MLGAYDVKGKSGCYEHFEAKRVVNNSVTLAVVPSRNLLVTVRDKTGNPLKEAEVYLNDEINATGYTFKSDTEGRVAISNLFAGLQYKLAARLVGYYDPQGNKTTYKPEKPDWKDALEIVMDDAGRTQKGKVVDEEGKPLPGVVVTSEIGSNAKTDANGEFTLTALPDAEIELSILTDVGQGTAKVSKDTQDLVIKIKRYKVIE